MPDEMISLDGATTPDAATLAKFIRLSTCSVFFPITVTLLKALLNGEYSPGGSVTAEDTGDTATCDRLAMTPPPGGIWPHSCGSDAIFVTCTPGGCLPLPGIFDTLLPEDGTTSASTCMAGFIAEVLTTFVLAVAGDEYIAIVFADEDNIACCWWAAVLSSGNNCRDTPLLPT